MSGIDVATIIVGIVLVCCAIAVGWWGFFSGEGDIRKINNTSQQNSSEKEVNADDHSNV